jgi:hypothetical protein
MNDECRLETNEANREPREPQMTTRRSFIAITAALAVGILFGAMGVQSVLAQGTAPKLTEQEAHAIGVDAYVYLYPLITMDITRKQLTNTDKGFGRGPMNVFHNVPAYPPASDKSVVRTNYDTLYSITYLDLLKEPVVVSVPDTGGRFYILPMLDMWTDVFASAGSRTTGTQATNFLVTPPGWRPDLRAYENRWTGGL